MGYSAVNDLLTEFVGAEGCDPTAFGQWWGRSTGGTGGGGGHGVKKFIWENDLINGKKKKTVDSQYLESFKDLSFSIVNKNAVLFSSNSMNTYRKLMAGKWGSWHRVSLVS